MKIKNFFSSMFSSPPLVPCYSKMEDEELLELSSDPDSLTKPALKALLAELDSRGLEPLPPADPVENDEKTPFLKRNLSEAKKCGCGGGCHK